MSKQPRIRVAGLGFGAVEQIGSDLLQVLERAKHLFLKTASHPITQWMNRKHIGYCCFDAIFPIREQVDEQIADYLVQTSIKVKEEIVYAVPGHPMFTDHSVRLLSNKCASNGIELHIDGGGDFLNYASIRFAFDPSYGFQLLDGTTLERKMIQPHMHTLIAHVYNQRIAKAVKSILLTTYPHDHLIKIGIGLGMRDGESLREIPLHELDRQHDYGDSCMVFIAKTDTPLAVNKQFDRLHEIVAVLRSPNGCPWDREQTHTSIRKHLMEETYEVLETIDDNDPESMKEELGDLLLQVMMHSQMEEEVGRFTVYDVIQTLNEKLIRRHPHVFGEKEAGNAKEALQNWEMMKQEEKQKKGQTEANRCLLDEVPRDLPGLLKAFAYQKKAAKVGFDWEKIDLVIAKVEEELQELKETIDQLEDYPHSEVKRRQEEELGDLLFSVVNVARFLNLDPERAIAYTNRKFKQRFSYIEQQLRLRRVKIEHTDLIEMEKLWQEAKRLLPNMDADSSQDLK